MRKLWLVFAQAVTATLAVIFVVSLVKPEWMAWRRQVVEVRESAPVPAAPTALPVGTLPAAGPYSYSEAARKAIPSVVNISATKQVRRRNPLLDDPMFQRFFGERFNMLPETQLSLGSGVIVSREGYILTNDHVVDGVSDIQVTLHDGRTLAGKIVGSDPETDLAVVRVSAAGLTPITFGHSEQAKVGDVVLAIGDPFSVGQTVTMGIVSAVGREITTNPFGSFIQTDAAINPGNSGGALVDAAGNLIGINTLIFTRSGGYQGIGFAIPVGLAKRIMEQIIETGSVTRGWFGIEVTDITPELAESLGLKVTQGAIVGAIERGSPAERSGVKLGDVILALNGRPVADTATTLKSIAAMPPGRSVPVKVLRGNRELTLEVVVGKRKPRPRPDEEAQQP
jgi:Do/DeqQ family serine protease